MDNPKLAGVIPASALVLEAIRVHWKDQGTGPTFREVADAVGCSLTAVDYHVGVLRERGLLDPVPPGGRGSPRGLRITRAAAADRAAYASEMARTYLEEDQGWQRIAALAADPSPRIAWPVLESLLAYAYGRPAQPLSNPDGSKLDLSSRVLVLSQEFDLEELRTMLAEIRERKALAAPPANVKQPTPGDVPS